MRLKLPILVGTLAFALTGNAIAGQGEAFFISFTNPSSSSAGTTSARPSKKVTNEKVAEKWGSKSYPISTVSSYGQISSDTPTRNSRDEFFYLPIADLRITANYSDNGYQTFGGLSQKSSHSYYEQSPSSDFLDGHGDRNNHEISDTFSKHFKNDDDFSKRVDDSIQYFNCSVTAVPEPNEWLLMLCGLGLIGYFVIPHIKKAPVSVWPASVTFI